MRRKRSGKTERVNPLEEMDEILRINNGNHSFGDNDGGYDVRVPSSSSVVLSVGEGFY